MPPSGHLLRHDLKGTDFSLSHQRIEPILCYPLSQTINSLELSWELKDFAESGSLNMQPLPGPYTSS
jgi:hypothetical protein